MASSRPLCPLCSSLLKCTNTIKLISEHHYLERARESSWQCTNVDCLAYFRLSVPIAKLRKVKKRVRVSKATGIVE